MSESTQEILDIVRAHGPIDLNGICAKVTLLSERTEIAAKLFKAKSRGDVLRRPDKTYVINGKNGTAQKPAPETPPPALVEQLSKPAREHAERTGELPEIPEATEPPQPRTLHDVIAKHTKPARPHDELVRDDPIETILREAVENAQRNLDAFIREAGDLARVLANLMEARDKTLAALFDYRNKSA